MPVHLSTIMPSFTRISRLTRQGALQRKIEVARRAERAAKDIVAVRVYFRWRIILAWAVGRAGGVRGGEIWTPWDSGARTPRCEKSTPYELRWLHRAPTARTLTQYRPWTDRMFGILALSLSQLDANYDINWGLTPLLDYDNVVAP